MTSDIERMVADLGPAAASGNPQAQYDLSVLYRDLAQRQLSWVHFEKAEALTRAAAAAGLPAAADALGHWDTMKRAFASLVERSTTASPCDTLTSVHALPLRLQPACDLRREIERAVSALPEQCGFVLSGIGSLTQASVRFAAAESPALLVEPLEVLTLSGTVTVEGAHLHVCVSTASGRVLGGHLAFGCRVRTTAEILVAVLPERTLSRQHDTTTGYKELTIARRVGTDAA